LVIFFEDLIEFLRVVLIHLTSIGTDVDPLLWLSECTLIGGEL
jgi:hypothetical protein